MDLTWLGAAGFKVTSGNGGLLIDPFLSRSRKAAPRQPLTPEDLADNAVILATHGHFDHIMDIPAICAAGNAVVHCGPEVAKTLGSLGVPAARIRIVRHDDCRFDLPMGTVRAFYSRHVRFDARLVGTALFRSAASIFRLYPMLRKFPAGRVLSWRLCMEGRNIHHFSSAGSSRTELERIAPLGTDVLLLPLQGHTRICDIVLEHVRILKPRVVIVQHHDDFFPPVSSTVDIGPFLRNCLRINPGMDVVVPEINRPVKI